jgi:hypothetical protein
MTAVMDAAEALRIVAAAQRSGMGPGAVCDALGITSKTLETWKKRPETVPQIRIRRRLAALRESIKAARKAGAK